MQNTSGEEWKGEIFVEWEGEMNLGCEYKKFICDILHLPYHEACHEYAPTDFSNDAVRVAIQDNVLASWFRGSHSDCCNCLLVARSNGLSTRKNANSNCCHWTVFCLCPLEDHSIFGWTLYRHCYAMVMVVVDKNVAALALNEDYWASIGSPWKFSVLQHSLQSLAFVHSYRNVNSSENEHEHKNEWDVGIKNRHTLTLTQLPSHKEKFNFVSHLKSLPVQHSIDADAVFIVLAFCLWFCLRLQWHLPDSMMKTMT